MRHPVRLSVDIMSAVRFRHAQSFCGETIWGTCAGALKHYTNSQRTSRNASSEERSDDLPLGDVYNRWMCDMVGFLVV